MSLYDHLLATRTKEALAKELAATAKENASLRDRVDALEHELFWLRAARPRFAPTHTVEVYTDLEAQLLELRDAVAALIKAKGRFHTEQNYAALVAAFDKLEKP
jgi:predicted RecB family nuclease